MSTHRHRFLAGALAIGLLGVAGGPALAQPLPTPAPQAMPMHPRQMHSFNARTDGRIAFLRAELKITPAQTAAFDTFAAALRQNADEMAAQMKKMQESHAADAIKKPPTALEQMERRVGMAKMQADQSQRYLDAFKPLYAQLSDEQKKTADEILGRDRRRGGPPHHRT